MKLDARCTISYSRDSVSYNYTVPNL